MTKQGITRYDNQLFSARRIEALSDGVFSIAMTLLVLDLSVQKISSITTSGGLFNLIMDDKESLIVFVVSFLLLGSMWAVHMRQFEYIKRADRRFTLLNTIRLLVVVLIPLTTSIAGTYPQLVLGRILLPINFLLLAVVSYIQWSYAVNPKHKLYDPVETISENHAKVRNQAAIILASVVCVAAIWIGELAFVFLLCIPLLTKFINSRSHSS